MKYIKKNKSVIRRKRKGGTDDDHDDDYLYDEDISHSKSDQYGEDDLREEYDEEGEDVEEGKDDKDADSIKIRPEIQALVKNKLRNVQDRLSVLKPCTKKPADEKEQIIEGMEFEYETVSIYKNINEKKSVKFENKYNTITKNYLESHGLMQSKVDNDWIKAQNEYIKTLSDFDINTITTYTDQFTNRHINNFLDSNTVDAFIDDRAIFIPYFIPQIIKICKISFDSQEQPIKEIPEYIRKMLNNYYNYLPPEFHKQPYFEQKEQLSEILIKSILPQINNYTDIDKFWKCIITIFTYDLNRIIYNSPKTRTNMTLYRGVKEAYYQQKSSEFIYTEPGFTATSLSIDFVLNSEFASKISASKINIEPDFESRKGRIDKEQDNENLKKLIDGALEYIEIDNNELDDKEIELKNLFNEQIKKLRKSINEEKSNKELKELFNEEIYNNELFNKVIYKKKLQILNTRKEAPCCLMVFRVPINTSCLFVAPASDIPGELEVVFPTNSKIHLESGLMTKYRQWDEKEVCYRSYYVGAKKAGIFSRIVNATITTSNNEIKNTRKFALSQVSIPRKKVSISEVPVASASENIFKIDDILKELSNKNKLEQQNYKKYKTDEDDKYCKFMIDKEQDYIEILKIILKNLNKNSNLNNTINVGNNEKQFVILINKINKAYFKSVSQKAILLRIDEVIKISTNKRVNTGTKQLLQSLYVIIKNLFEKLDFKDDIFILNDNLNTLFDTIQEINRDIKNIKDKNKYTIKNDKQENYTLNQYIKNYYYQMWSKYNIETKLNKINIVKPETNKLLKYAIFLPLTVNFIYNFIICNSNYHTAKYNGVYGSNKYELKPYTLFDISKYIDYLFWNLNKTIHPPISSSPPIRKTNRYDEQADGRKKNYPFKYGGLLKEEINNDLPLQVPDKILFKGRKYNVHIGVRGGKYIMYNKKKKYLI